MDFFEGMLKITNVVLAIVAGYIAIGLFRISHERRDLRAWKPLIIALLFFMIQGILGALRAFEIFSSPYITHIVPAIVLAFIIYALAVQIHIHLTEK